MPTRAAHKSHSAREGTGTMRGTRSQERAWHVGRAVAAINGGDGVYAYPTSDGSYAQSFESLSITMGGRRNATDYIELGVRAALQF